MVEVIALDGTICKQRHMKEKIIKHLNSMGYLVNHGFFGNELHDGYWNTLFKERTGLKGCLFGPEELFQFSYDCEKSLIKIRDATDNKDLEMKMKIANEVFNIEFVDVIIKKDYC